jgi:hypothetical protein
MGYLLFMLIVLLIGALALLALKPGRRGRARTDDDVTSRSPAHPVRPNDPLPGSATRRHQQGKP